MSMEKTDKEKYFWSQGCLYVGCHCCTRLQFVVLDFCMLKVFLLEGKSHYKSIIPDLFTLGESVFITLLIGKDDK